MVKNQPFTVMSIDLEAGFVTVLAFSPIPKPERSRAEDMSEKWRDTDNSTIRTSTV